jgi:hypothetical protein
MRTNSRTILALLLVAALGLAAGCAPKAAVKDVQITAMAVTNYTSSGYDTTPFRWNIGQNTLQSSGSVCLHVKSSSYYYGLPWSSGSPLLAVQHWDHQRGSIIATPLLTTMSTEVQLLVPAREIWYSPDLSGGACRWYTPEDSAFVTTAPSEILPSSSQKTPDGTPITVTEYPLAAGSTVRRLTILLPSGLSQVEVLYGSGNTTTGFVFVQAQKATAHIMDVSLWLLRISAGKATWIDCGPAAEFGISDQGPSFARVGALLYFTHSSGKIYCVDTAAASPTVTAPEQVNALLDKLRKQPTPADIAGPLQAALASDDGMLIIGYPDAEWNQRYYAVDASGTSVGSLRADKTSVTSFDAEDKQGSSLPFKNTEQYIRFPSADMFDYI